MVFQKLVIFTPTLMSENRAGLENKYNKDSTNLLQQNLAIFLHLPDATSYHPCISLNIGHWSHLMGYLDVSGTKKPLTSWCVAEPELQELRSF